MYYIKKLKICYKLF